MVRSSVGRRRGSRALAASLALATAGLLWAAPALAEDSRDDIAQKKDAAAAQIDSLNAEIDGIDANLSAIYKALAEANAKIPVAQKTLEDAQSRRDAANRAHEIALGQLVAAQGDQEALEKEIAEAEAKQQQANEAIGDLARRMYKNGSSSAVVVALTKSGTESIDERAAAADAMARSQSQALNAALDVKATQRTQVSRQKAITERIAELEAQAEKALEEARAAEADAQASLAALEAAKKDAEAKQAVWDSKKSEANAQLAQSQADYDSMTAKLQAIDAANRAQNTSYTSSSGFRNPLPDASMIITSPFGWRMHPVLGYAKFHAGTDFGATCGTPIYAVADGVVAAVSSNVSAGNYVDVNHGMMGGNSVVTEYLHMQAIYVSPGQYVSAGTVLGQVGMTGYATGCHLHFGVLQNGVNVDPMGYL